MLTGIYAIYSADNICLYVGQSLNIERRFKKHLCLLKNGKHLRKDFVNWFTNSKSELELRILALCEANSDMLNKLEIFYFNKLNPKFYGKLPSTKDSFQQSSATKNNISEAMITFHKNLGSYMEITCACGKIFFTVKCKIRKFCSVECRKFYLQSSLDYNKVVKLYNSGMSLHAVGSELGVSYRTVHQFMVKNNIPRRK